MDQDNLYFLKISGTVSAPKQHEFVQTVQFVFNHISTDCIIHNLALDVHTAELFHLYSVWKTDVSLYTFKCSHGFELIKGAFQTLGSYKDALSGRQVDIQLFELNRLDN